MENTLTARPDPLITIPWKRAAFFMCAVLVKVLLAAAPDGMWIVHLYTFWALSQSPPLPDIPWNIPQSMKNVKSVMKTKAKRSWRHW